LGQPGFNLESIGVNLGSTWGQPGVNPGSVWDQPGVNPGSAAPPYLAKTMLAAVAVHLTSMRPAARSARRNCAQL
jgi:hypothetical protein